MSALLPGTDERVLRESASTRERLAPVFYPVLLQRITRALAHLLVVLCVPMFFGLDAADARSRPLSKPRKKPPTPRRPAPLRPSPPPPRSPVALPRRSCGHHTAAWRLCMKAFPLPQDPRWDRVGKQLLSKAAPSLPRLRAVRWLAARPISDKVATRLLLLILQHPAGRTRAWAAAALRNRPGASVEQALRGALNDRAEGVRLNAVVALGERGKFAWIRKKLRDRARIVREAACKQTVQYIFDGYPKQKAPTLPIPRRAAPMPRRGVPKPTSRKPVPARRSKLGGPRLTNGKLIIRPNNKDLQQLLRRCLRDQASVVRIGTAELLRSFRPNVPSALKRDVRLVMRLRHRRPYHWRRRRRRYNAQWQLRRYRRYIKNYLTSIRYRIKRSNGMFDRKLRVCYRRYYAALLGQQEQFLRWQLNYARFARGGRGRAAQLALSRALLSFRAAQVIRQKANRCRQKFPPYRVKRKYRKLLRKSLLLPGAPAVFPIRSRFSAMAEFFFAVDNAIDFLRHDIRPAQVPEGRTVTGPFADVLLGARLQLDAIYSLTKRLQFQGRIRFGGAYVPGLQQLSGFDARGVFRLMHIASASRRKHVFFLEEDLHLTPGLLHDEGHPDVYAGSRLVQQFRMGGTWRWGRLYRRWTRMDEWVFHLSYRNRIIHPLATETTTPVWATRMNHLVRLELQRQLFFFWVGAKGTAEVDHFLQQSARVPTVRGTIWATFTLGNPYDPIDFLRLEGAVGYGFMLPLNKDEPFPAPAPHEASDASAPLAYAGVFGQLPKLPFQWRVQYWHRFGGPTRPPFAHFIEDRLRAEVRFGVPKELQTLFPREMLILLGLDASVVNYGHAREGDDKDKTKAPPKLIRDISIFGEFKYPLFWGLMLVVGNRLSFVRNDFVPYRADNGNASNNIVRNVFYVNLQYWLGPSGPRITR